jgi:hypothetical protein
MVNQCIILRPPTPRCFATKKEGKFRVYTEETETIPEKRDRTKKNYAQNEKKQSNSKNVAQKCWTN